MGTRSAVAASVVGLLFTASAWELGPGAALLLGLGVARASADIARARSILNRRPPPRSRSLTNLFWWLSWELVELPDDADEAAPADDLLTRILCASLDGRIQLVGLMAAMIILFGASPLVSADSRMRLGLAGVLVAGASLAHLPRRARALGAQVRKRSSLLARVAASGAVLLLAFATALSSMPAVILGLLAAAVAFEAIRRTSLGLVDSAPVSRTPQGVEATPEKSGAWWLLGPALLLAFVGIVFLVGAGPVEESRSSLVSGVVVLALSIAAIRRALRGAGRGTIVRAAGLAAFALGPCTLFFFDYNGLPPFQISDASGAQWQIQRDVPGEVRYTTGYAVAVSPPRIDRDASSRSVWVIPVRFSNDQEAETAHVARCSLRVDGKTRDPHSERREIRALGDVDGQIVHFLEIGRASCRERVSYSV